MALLHKMYDAKVNSPQTSLAQAVGKADTDIQVEDASVLPPGPNLAVIGDGDTAETVHYSGINTNILTGCTRGFEGEAASWQAGTVVARNITAYDHQAFKTNLEELDRQNVSYEIKSYRQILRELQALNLPQETYDMAKAQVDQVVDEWLAKYGVTVSEVQGVLLLEDVTNGRVISAFPMYDTVYDDADLDARVGHIEEGSELTVVSSDPDADGVYKTVTWTRRDGTTYAKSTLSGDPYNRLTMAYYDKAGTGVDKTIAWALTIDANGIVSRKELI